MHRKRCVLGRVTFYLALFYIILIVVKNGGAGSLREAELLKEGEDETIHVVERR